MHSANFSIVACLQTDASHQAPLAVGQSVAADDTAGPATQESNIEAEMAALAAQIEGDDLPGHILHVGHTGNLVIPGNAIFRSIPPEDFTQVNNASSNCDNLRSQAGFKSWLRIACIGPLSCALYVCIMSGRLPSCVSHLFSWRTTTSNTGEWLMIT